MKFLGATAQAGNTLQVVNSPPVGLKDDHVLLSLCDATLRHDLTSARAAAKWPHRKNRKIPVSMKMGTVDKWFSHPYTWTSFGSEYRQAGHALAAYDCYSEALRLSMSLDGRAVNASLEISDKLPTNVLWWWPSRVDTLTKTGQ